MFLHHYELLLLCIIFFTWPHIIIFFFFKLDYLCYGHHSRTIIMNYEFKWNKIKYILKTENIKKKCYTYWYPFYLSQMRSWTLFILTDYSLYPNLFQVILYFARKCHIIISQKKLLKIEICISEVHILKGKCLLRSFKCLLQ